MAETTTLSGSHNDQGTFLDKGVHVVDQIPDLNLAFLSNKFVSSQIDEVINLNPICLNWCDFTNLFFTPGSRAFYISPSNVLNKAISFYNQTYETTQSPTVVYTLAEQIKKTWSKKTSKPESLIPPEINIQLTREGFLTKTLRNVTGKVVALSLDEALNALLSSNSIVPADSESTATVRFIISYADTFEPLDTTVMVNFIYKTKIPCFKNVNDCEGFCPYSKEVKPCRIDFDETATVVSETISEDKSMISGLTELINANKTVDTDGSW
jgi:hypothetical protein